MRMVKGLVLVVAVFLVSAAVLFLFAGQGQVAAGEPEPAPDFLAVGSEGQEVRLSQFRGKVLILHFTQLENPLCLECESYMIGQLEELQSASELSGGEVSILTVNIRKNPYSEAGWSMAESYYGLGISWTWVEDLEPYPASRDYLRYWELDGAFSNPSLVMIDEEGLVVGVYHVYAIGRGSVDGVRSAESLLQDAQDIASGDWEVRLQGTGQGGSVTYGGMFLLGVLTSFSPCSIGLLIAMISYIGTLHEGKQPEKRMGRALRGTWIGLAFTLGMAMVFFVIGLFVSYLGVFVQASQLFYLISGLLLVFLGLRALDIPPFDFTWSGRDSKNAGGRPRWSFMEAGRKGILGLGKRSTFLAAFALGVLFSVGWAPCALTLVFPVIVLLMTQSIALLTGGLLMLAFGLGHGLVVVPFCAATGEFKGRLSQRYVSAARYIKWGFGLAIVLIGIIFALRYFGLGLW